MGEPVLTKLSRTGLRTTKEDDGSQESKKWSKSWEGEQGLTKASMRMIQSLAGQNDDTLEWTKSLRS